MAFRNFLVVNGFGRGIVVSANNQNYIANDKNDGHDSISRDLSHIAINIALMSTFFAILYLIVWVSSLRLSSYYTWSWRDVVYATLNVAFVGMPIGLPVSFMVGLYLVSRGLHKSRVFVKSIFSILLTNNIDVVLTDKTGTLTRNSLEVASVLYSTNEVDVDDVYLSGQVALEQLLDLCDFCTQESSVALNLMEQALFEFAQKNRPPGLKKLSEEFQVIDQIEFNNNMKYIFLFIYFELFSCFNYFVVDKISGEIGQRS
jgi:magnesium-transporting ATPase (P-type)